MGTRVDFVRLRDGSGEPQRLFTLRETGARILASGPELADAIVVLRRPVEVAERRIPRAEKPMDWIAHLPAAYDQAPLTAGAPEKDETLPIEVLTREKTLLAFQDAKNFFFFEGGRVRDAAGEAVSLTAYRRALSSKEEWEVLVPLAEILEAVSPHVTAPTLDELTRAFFGELERFRREYSNWTSLYRKGEVWEKVLLGTPEERIPKGASAIDRGLLGRVGATYYPRIERGLWPQSQAWRLGEAPGAEISTLEALVVREPDARHVPQLLTDLTRLRIPTKIVITRVATPEAERRSKEFRELVTRHQGLIEGERYFLLLAPPTEKPSDPWHLVKADPASGEPWLFSAWG